MQHVLHRPAQTASPTAPSRTASPPLRRPIWRHATGQWKTQCLWGIWLSPLAAYTVDLLTTQDDLGRGAMLESCG